MTYYRTLLRERGIASTRQRALILKSMRERTDHPDAEAVFVSLRRELPSLALDTVYRTLRLFAAENLIQQLALPTHRFHFDGNADPHDHFLCTACETVADIAAAEGAEQTHQIPEAVRHRGDVHAVQQVFLGTCRRCADGRWRARERSLPDPVATPGHRGCPSRRRRPPAAQRDGTCTTASAGDP